MTTEFVPIDENGDPVAPTEVEVSDPAEKQARCFHTNVSSAAAEPDTGQCGYFYCDDCGTNF